MNKEEIIIILIWCWPDENRNIQIPRKSRAKDNNNEDHLILDRQAKDTHGRAIQLKLIFVTIFCVILCNSQRFICLNKISRWAFKKFRKQFRSQKLRSLCLQVGASFALLRNEIELSRRSPSDGD